MMERIITLRLTFDKETNIMHVNGADSTSAAFLADAGSICLDGALAAVEREYLNTWVDKDRLNEIAYRLTNELNAAEDAYNIWWRDQGGMFRTHVRFAVVGE